MGRFQMRPCPDARMVVRGWLLRNDRGSGTVSDKEVFTSRVPIPTALPWAIVLRPAGAGLKTKEYPNVASNGFCRGERPLALLPRDWLQGYRLCNCDPRPHVIPTIPHQCHFGHPPLSFRAQREILARKARFLSRSLSHLFEAGSFEMTRGRVPSHTNRFLPRAVPYPRRCRGLLYCAPQERG